MCQIASLYLVMYNSSDAGWRTPPFLPCPLVQDMTSSFCHMIGRHIKKLIVFWDGVL